MRAGDARSAALILASHTGWGLDELLELDGGELREWLRALEAAQPRMPR